MHIIAHTMCTLIEWLLVTTALSSKRLLIKPEAADKVTHFLVAAEGE